MTFKPTAGIKAVGYISDGEEGIVQGLVRLPQDVRSQIFRFMRHPVADMIKTLTFMRRREGVVYTRDHMKKWREVRLLQACILGPFLGRTSWSLFKIKYDCDYGEPLSGAPSSRQKIIERSEPAFQRCASA